MRQLPDFIDTRVEVLFISRPVKVLSVYGDWVEVEWIDETGYHRGWVPARWITLLAPVPPGQITATANP